MRLASSPSTEYGTLINVSGTGEKHCACTANQRLSLNLRYVASAVASD
ncbi:Uncharacterised protein [Mycobacteroides abscessus subsp. abscessus]|nr:Uncharacterised protein [Mycobacteroides abscessus subsp. abscessus]